MAKKLAALIEFTNGDKSEYIYDVTYARYIENTDMFRIEESGRVHLFPRENVNSFSTQYYGDDE